MKLSGKYSIHWRNSVYKCDSIAIKKKRKKINKREETDEYSYKQKKKVGIV